MNNDEFEPWCGSCSGEELPVEPSGAIKNQSFVPYKRSDLKRAGAGEGFVFVRHDSERRKPAHTEQALISAIEESMSIFHRRWGFVPTRLAVVIKEMKPMGSSWTKSAREPHIMSLSWRLVSEYGMKSIKRTILHELSHFYRANLNGYKAMRPKHGHDAKFCDILGAVDPLVGASKAQCRFFQDDIDDGAVAKQEKLKRGARMELEVRSKMLHMKLIDGDGRVIEPGRNFDSRILRKTILLAGGDPSVVKVTADARLAKYLCLPGTSCNLREAALALANDCGEREKSPFSKTIEAVVKEFGLRKVGSGRATAKAKAKPKAKPAEKSPSKAKGKARSSRR